MSVAFLDLDRFKNVNDSLGHDAGDELLIAVARRIESVIRPGDTVARFGGDEFTILCEFLPSQTAQAQSIEIAERLLAAVIQPIVVRGTEMYVGASIGIALGDLGRGAARGAAPRRRRGDVPRQGERPRPRRGLRRHDANPRGHRARDRERAAPRPRARRVPAVLPADRAVSATPAASGRRRCCAGSIPNAGLLAPAEFIPLAEETGLVVEMGWWVIEEAARNAARWQLEQSDPIQVAINLSARQLTQPDLADRVGDRDRPDRCAAVDRCASRSPRAC